MAVVASWLEGAGLGHLAPAFGEVGEDSFRELLMQDYARFGVTAIDDKQKLFRLIKKINAAHKTSLHNQIQQEATEMAHHTAEAERMPTASVPQSSPAMAALDGLDGNAGLLDLNDIDGDLISSSADLLGQDDYLVGIASSPRRQQEILGPISGPRHHAPAILENSSYAPPPEETDPPKIRVVVRKRPLNKKEIEKADPDIVDVLGPSALQVNETKTKVDLAKYTESHIFSFDDTLDDNVTNDDVYRCTVQPLVNTLFRGGKATCFAYGQTGSGKTYTMQPLPIRAGEEIASILTLPEFSHFQLWVSNFEIYGGKLYDLLNARKKLQTLQDANKKVCIVGLQEHLVEDSCVIQQLIDHGAGARSVGCTGANADSSRSHSIVQFAVKKPLPSGNLRLVGKLSFIDLAGSERGADTYDNDRQTRLEGAEINKSLLALKECIRALDLDKGHVPFRGSKLTEVLRDSFVGKEARTVMIANISPNCSSVEHTLNTLRYADRVKELRKEKADRVQGGVTPGMAGYNRAQPAPLAQPVVPVHPPAPTPAPGPGVFVPRPNTAPAPRPSPAPKKAPASKAMQAAQRDQRAILADNHQQLPAVDDVDPAKEADELFNSQRNDLVSSILQLEDDLIAAHRQQIEETMELVRKEMNLLSEVDQPGSKIDAYVANLSAILVKKAEGTARLQAQLDSFQFKLKEEEDMSRSYGELHPRRG